MAVAAWRSRSTIPWSMATMGWRPQSPLLRIPTFQTPNFLALEGRRKVLSFNVLSRASAGSFTSSTLASAVSIKRSASSVLTVR